MEGGDYNIPFAFLKKGGDKETPSGRSYRAVSCGASNSYPRV